MKATYSDVTLFKMAKEKGFLASTEGERNTDTGRNAKDLSKYFKENYSTYNELFSGDIDTEEVLYYINWFIDRHEIDKPHVEFPISGGADLHLLPITDNIQLVVFVANEYYGDPNYTKYIEIEFFIINKETTEDEVDDLIEFLKELSDF